MNVESTDAADGLWQGPDIQGITDRLIASIVHLSAAGERTRYVWLEGRTGVAAGRWKNLLNRKQQATLEMVQAWARVQPELALWLLTGSDRGALAEVSAIRRTSPLKANLYDRAGIDTMEPPAR